MFVEYETLCATEIVSVKRINSRQFKINIDGSKKVIQRLLRTIDEICSWKPPPP